ncbi:MAG: Hsp20/alpha crystallin family protein [Alphaproteobacteria bacterium]|nr:MAG: Hsp20/alpha crystallin family protein [Alphaproteobacteria bacterium]
MERNVEVSKAQSPGTTTPAPSRGPVHPLLALREQMDRLFDDFLSDVRWPSLSRDLFSWEPFQSTFSGTGALDVRFDVAETDEAIEVSAELPGMDEKDIEVTLADGVLTIKGEKKAESETKERDYYLKERRYGAFSRSIRVPETVDPDAITARFDKGVLTVLLPKRPEAQSRKKKIEITHG